MRWKRFAGTLAGAGLGIAVLTAGASMLYAGKALPGTKVGPLHVGGMTEAEIRDMVATRASGVKELKFAHQGREYVVAGDDVGLTLDPAASARTAVTTGKSQPFGALWAALRSTVDDRVVDPAVALNESVLRDILRKRTEGLVKPARNADVVREDTTFRITKEEPGTVVDVAASARAARRSVAQFETKAPLIVRPQEPDVRAATLTPARAYAEYLANTPFTVTAAGRSFNPEPATLAGWVKFHRFDAEAADPAADPTAIRTLDQILDIGQTDKPIIGSGTRTLRAGIDEEAVGTYVATLAEEVDAPPVNARLSFEGGQLKVTGAARPGTVLERKQAVSRISTAMREAKRTADLPFMAKQADIRDETLPQLKITTLIGTATTTFEGSPVNRTYNIGVGARQFDGILIKPGEDFSFNRILGDVGPETGYRPELVIKENKTVPEYGGGLCQVSTTMFRAAMDAGLPITARTNHSYAVHYYAPIGMDATIYPPNPDMRFKNNSPGYILVQTRQVGTSLTFDFYGTSDGRQARTEIIHINASEANGGTASFRYVVEGGPEPINRVFSSSYQPQSKFPISRSLN